MVGVEKREDRPVLLEKIGEESFGFLLHRAPQTGELREVALALLVEGGDIAHVQPLAAELAGQP